MSQWTFQVGLNVMVDETLVDITSGTLQTNAYAESNGAVKRLHRHLKDELCATATWAEEIPCVLLGLGSQPREDTCLSPAEAILAPCLVLPKEFLQAEEFSIDKIATFFSKILDAPVFSLPSKHNLDS